DYREHREYHDRDHGRGGVRIEVDVRKDRDRCDPVYEDRETRIWVEPVYRTVCDRVWVEPVVRSECDRVWVPERCEYREVVRYERGCRRIYRERVVVEPGVYVE